MSPDTNPEVTIETRTSVPQVPVAPTSPDPCLVQIYPAGPALDTRFVLKDTALVLGRGADCNVRIEDQAVSRRHAAIEPDGDGFCVIDLNSTNGTYVNQLRVGKHKLQDGDNLYIGHAIYRFLAGGNIEAAYHEEIQRLAILDPLTELHNKRFLQEFLERELQRSERYSRPLALLMFDIDHFKAINDQLGHLGGDFTLRELAACLKAVMRKEGLLARYGGEEFAAVLPESSLDDGLRVAERVRQQVEKHRFEYEGKQYPVTVSLGVAATPGGEALTPEQFILQADENLYQAKREGRNRVMPPPAGKDTATQDGQAE